MKNKPRANYAWKSDIRDGKKEAIGRALTLIHDMALTRKAEPGKDRNASAPETSQNSTAMA